MAPRRTPSGRRDPRGQAPAPRRRRQRRKVPPAALAIIAVVVVVGIIALIARGGDEPVSSVAAAEPVIPAISEEDIAAAAEQLGPRDQELVSIGETGVSINRAGGARKYVALTFDDGPGPDTPAVLAELKKLDVPATFFVIGRNVKENPQVLNQVVAAGHEIGVHTWNHPDLTTLTPKEQESEIASTAGEIVAVVGIPSIDIGSTRHAVLGQGDRRVQVGEEQGVDHEPGAVGDPDRLLAAVRREVLDGLDGALGRGHRLDHLDDSGAHDARTDHAHP